MTYEAFRVTKKAPPVFLMKRAPASPVSAAVAAAVAGSDAAVTPVIIPDKMAAAAVLSPVFSIKAIAVGSNGGSIERSSSAGSDRIAAAVVAKEGAKSEVTPPASPLIAVGREGCVAVEDHLLLPLAAVLPAAGSNGMWGRTCSPADAQVIIRSASSASLAKDVTTDPQAAAAAAAAMMAAMGPAAATAGSTDGSSKLGKSPVEYGVQQDEAGCDSSSRAGAGGPSDAAGC